MKKSIIKYLICLTFLFLSCSDGDWKEIYYPDGILKVKVQIDEKGDLNGIQEEYYNSGELKLKTIVTNGRFLDTVYIYSKQGYIKEKGLMTKGLKTSWWLELNKEGKKIAEREYIINGNDKLVENQIKRYSVEGNLDLKSSWFFDIETNGFILGNHLRGKISYYSTLKGRDELIYAVIENDTFYGGKNGVIPFSVKVSDKDIISLKGVLFEEILRVEKINDTLSSLEQITYNKYFEETYKIQDSVVSIESFSKAKTL